MTTATMTRAALEPAFAFPQPLAGEAAAEYVQRVMQSVREWRAADEYDRQKRWREAADFGTGPLLPTRERAQHDPVEQLARPIADENGNVAQPYRSVDTLERMFRARRITPEEYAAACDFRSDFAAGQLNQLRAVEMGRIRGGGREPAYGAAAMEARDRVRDACLALGARGDNPTSSAAASGVWFVVGVGETIKEWVRRMRWGSGGGMREETGSTILITGLGVLAGHYEREGQGMKARDHRATGGGR